MIAPRRATGMVTYNRRPRSLWGNLSLVLSQPVVFYQSFPAARQWLVVAALMLILNGFSAVNQPTPQDQNQVTGTGLAPAQEMPGLSGGGISSGIDGGFIPPPDLGGASGGSTASPNVSRTVMTALLAAGGVVLAWFIQAIILSEVSLINGTRPSFGHNLQIAVWASVPLGLMLLIQQIYFAAGGEPGHVGLSLLLERWEGFAALPAFSRAVLMTFFSNLTLFWLWSLTLLYLGGRYVLNGKRVAVLLVVVAWIIISTFVPALTSPSIGDVPAPEPVNLEGMPGDFSELSPAVTQEVDESGETFELTPETSDADSIQVAPPPDGGEKSSP